LEHFQPRRIGSSGAEGGGVWQTQAIYRRRHPHRTLRSCDVDLALGVDEHILLNDVVTATRVMALIGLHVVPGNRQAVLALYRIRLSSFYFCHSVNDTGQELKVS
jgi:hypothetical protein